MVDAATRCWWSSARRDKDASAGNHQPAELMVFTFRDGKVARYEEFYEEQDALEAAGLRE